ncbi:MAG: DUF1700 domain-containing protein [Acholeplasmataceae bacterium]|jgi:uncharacterized membrane protein
MTKELFLQELRNKLKGLPKNDIEDRLSFYNEMIEDLKEEGFSEEEAINEIGSTDEIASKIIEETSFTKIIKEKVKPKRRLKPWEIVLLVLGFPLWFPLLIVGLILIMVALILVWSAVIVVYSIEASLIGAAISGTANTFVLLFEGNGLASLSYLGITLLSTGLAIFLFFGCKAATEYTFLLTKKIILSIKKALVGGGEGK